MSIEEEYNSGSIRDTDEWLRAIERFWKLELPDTFRNLYRYFGQPFLAPCEFFTLNMMSAGYGRAFGMLPQFLPFGRSIGEGGLYGFYVTPHTIQGYLPVIYWDEDEMYFRPVASSFEAFLRHCIVVGRYETEDQWTDETGSGEQSLIGTRLSLDKDIVFGPLPRNDTELYETLARSDPQDAVSLCHLGCVHRARGDNERAIDFFHRAIEAAPWFGDSSYLLADTYRASKNLPRAVQAWWAVTQRLLILCTRTWEWNLGDEHPEADVYEIAADALAQHADDAGFEIKSTALWRVVTQDDPYDPDVRESYAEALLAGGDLEAAERELLNALSLCSAEQGKQPDRLYNQLCDLYDRQGRSRDLKLALFDRALRRAAH